MAYNALILKKGLVKEKVFAADPAPVADPNGQGFILTCSTYPTGPGVKLELSANADMWAVSSPI